MRGNGLGRMALALAVTLGACGRKAEAPSAVAAAPVPEEPRIEADADARLRAASATLAAAQALSFSTRERHERVNAAGEKKARESSREILVARPDKLWMKRLREGATAMAVYDGSNLSLQSDDKKAWSQVDMPPTLDEAFDYAAAVYRFPMPVADLLYSDPYGSLVSDDTSLRLAGKETINGLPCDQIRIETSVVEADLWVAEGAQALPCKLELVYKQMDQMPRSTIVFSDWNLAPTFDPKRFEFVAPKDYHKIPMVAVLSPDEEKLVRDAQSAKAGPDAGTPATAAPAAAAGTGQ